MKFLEQYKKSIFKINNNNLFTKLAIQAFKYQYSNNEVYNEYCNLIKIDPLKVNCLEKIPFLPVSIFKYRKVISGHRNVEKVFSSSSTTGQVPSLHYVCDIDLYEQSFLSSFKLFYGDVKNYVFLALLPSYLERKGSSLIYMVNRLLELSEHKQSGFFLNNYDELLKKIIELEEKSQKYILLGVSFALLDFVERYNIKISNGIVIETGGMKGRRKEITREELHSILRKSFSVKNIHSEYGMAELLSQAYSKKAGIFRSPNQMRVLIRDAYDPTVTKISGKGAINIIDLANIHSCCFIATSDIGEVYEDGSFSILGRYDDSEIRGCNLLIY